MQLTTTQREAANAMMEGAREFQGIPLPDPELQPSFYETFIPNRANPLAYPEGTRQEVKWWVACTLAQDLFPTTINFVDPLDLAVEVITFDFTDMYRARRYHQSQRWWVLEVNDSSEDGAGRIIERWKPLENMQGGIKTYDTIYKARYVAMQKSGLI